MSIDSDINVGSIEEDIKILKELMEDVELTFAGWVDILNEREKKALKNLLQDYTRQKQINEEHQKINCELREKVKELEDKYILEKVAKEEVEELLEDSIPKQKIKDIVNECIPKKENITTHELEYTPNVNANSYLVQQILELLQVCNITYYRKD